MQDSKWNSRKQCQVLVFLGLQETSLGLEIGLIPLPGMEHGKKPDQQWGHSSVFKDLLFLMCMGISFPVNTSVPDADIWSMGFTSQDTNLALHMYTHTYIQTQIYTSICIPGPIHICCVCWFSLHADSVTPQGHPRRDQQPRRVLLSQQYYSTGPTGDSSGLLCISAKLAWALKVSRLNCKYCLVTTDLSCHTIFADN